MPSAANWRISSFNLSIPHPTRIRRPLGTWNWNTGRKISEAAKRSGSQPTRCSRKSSPSTREARRIPRCSACGTRRCRDVLRKQGERAWPGFHGKDQGRRQQDPGESGSLAPTSTGRVSQVVCRAFSIHHLLLGIARCHLDRRHRPWQQTARLLVQTAALMTGSAGGLPTWCRNPYPSPRLQTVGAAGTHSESFSGRMALVLESGYFHCSTRSEFQTPARSLPVKTLSGFCTMLLFFLPLSSSAQVNSGSKGSDGALNPA